MNVERIIQTQRNIAQWHPLFKDGPPKCARRSAPYSGPCTAGAKLVLYGQPLCSYHAERELES